MGIPIRRRLALLRVKLSRVLPLVLALAGMLMGASGVSMGLNQKRQDELEQMLWRKGVVCLASRDVRAGERVSLGEAVQCIEVKYRTDMLSDILRGGQEQQVVLTAPHFFTALDQTMVAAVDISRGQPVSPSEFFVPPRIIPDQAIVVISGFNAVDPYSDIVLVYPVPYNEGDSVVIPEYPDARWLRVRGKCIEIADVGCLFAISDAVLLGPRIMSPDNILAVISGNDTLEFLEVFATITSHTIWYTNFPSLPEDRRFVPVVPSPSGFAPQPEATPTLSPTETISPTGVPTAEITPAAEISATETVTPVVTPSP